MKPGAIETPSSDPNGAVGRDISLHPSKALDPCSAGILYGVKTEISISRITIQNLTS